MNKSFAFSIFLSIFILGCTQPTGNAVAEEANFVTASHILVETQQEAESIVSRLNSGEDFAELAKELSIGPSGQYGGNLGEFGRGVMVKPFEDKAFELRINEVGIAETQFGWHVIKVTDRKS